MTSPKNISQPFSAKAMLLQAMVGVMIFVIVFLASGQRAAWSSLYGVAVAMFMAFMLAKSIGIASGMPAAQAASAMIVLYLGAVIRFVLVLVLLGVGFWWLKADPVPVLSGFAVVQLAGPLLMKMQR